MDGTENDIFLRGSLVELPEFSHENHGKRFYRFYLEVARLSGTADILPVIAPEDAVMALDPCAGSMLAVRGQIRSHNLTEQGRRKLMVFVFAREVCAEDGEPENQVNLSGVLCREPVYRKTPLGREICDVMLALPRAFHRADYLPCILWGRTARECARTPVGGRLTIQGRLQSRRYCKQTPEGAQERITYEVSALTAQTEPPF